MAHHSEGKHHNREWTQEQRDELSSGKIKGEFAGPHQSYPIAGPNDVADAWNMAGRADDPNEVRRNVIRIAMNSGWDEALPETAQNWIREQGANS